ncbi:hypothetical protein AB0D08_28170 [Kitasatospora sp. NPDC048540]|uniref:hypothetical protein n=1 Tax=unclassified Kitasatospora TaxID=2633591 RepID=UPI00053B6116|nr:hypothetical protein [Kitasatospora sp. MBT63]
MPTTKVETPLSDPLFEREVAKRLSFWWRQQGVDLNHVLTRFADLPGHRVFSGPFPLGGAPGEDLATNLFALVTCVVSHERDAAFRRSYALAVRAALSTRIPVDRIFVSFEPTDPADHFTPGTAWAEPTQETP